MELLLNTRLGKYFIKKKFGFSHEAIILCVKSNVIYFEVDSESKQRVYRENISSMPIFSTLQKLFILPLLVLSKGIISPIAFFILSTDTASTKNKIARIISSVPTTNFGNSFTAGNFGGSTRNGLIDFTMSTGSGTISKVTMFLYSTGEIRSGGTHSVHQLTRTNWTQAGCTWNKYDGTNNWTTAGGDYSATVIYTTGTISGTAGWVSFDIMGGSASNPLTLNWGDDVNLLVKVATGTSEVDYDAITNLPYLEITYSATTNVTVNASVNTSTFTIPAYTVTAERFITVTPSTPSATFTIPNPTESGGAGVAGTVQTATFSIPSYTIVADGGVVISPSVKIATFNVPLYQPVIDTTVQSTLHVCTFTIPAYTVTLITGVTANPSVQVATFSIPTYRVIADYWEDKFAQPANGWNDKY